MTASSNPSAGDDATSRRGRKRFLALMGLFAVLPSTVLAQPAHRQWHCGEIRELASFAVNYGALVLNNFHLREAVGMFSRRPYVEITFSAVNRHPDSKFLSLQFVGLRETNDVVLALSAEPGMSMVSANSNEQVTASVNVTDGELREIARFCIRADGDFR